MSRMSSEVAASVSVQLAPPLVVRASEPPAPYANAVDELSAATVLTSRAGPPPMGTNEAPPPPDPTVAPSTPTATTRSGEGTATALIAAVAGDTESHDPPPFVVRT